jgi:dTDP-4-amino-4,6-dideoxygalactose transaminase
MMDVPYHRAAIGQEEIDEVVATLRSGWLTTGKRTRDFELAFSNYVGAEHAVAMNSCTAALHLGLEACGVGEGDAVIVPTMTFAATAEVVRYLGAKPIFVDCQPNDGNLDPSGLRAAVTRAETQGLCPSAIMPVHYGGQICDLQAVHRFSREHGLRVIEDAAHCCPAHFREDENSQWQSVGSSSDVTCFSFYANKCITTGEGGMATTDNAELADRMRTMSLHGLSRDAWKRFSSDGGPEYLILDTGYKYNLTDIASALGIHQLARADELHRRRTAVANRYLGQLSDLSEVRLPVELPNRRHAWHLFVIRLDLDSLSIDRPAFTDEMRKRGISTSLHWRPLHMHPYYVDLLGHTEEDFPNAARLYREMISLPIFPDMSEQQVDYVCATIRDIISEHLRYSQA